MQDKPKLNLTDEERRILRESFIEAFGEAGSAKRASVTREIASGIGDLLDQEYRYHHGQVWLFTLGKPARPLTAQEVSDAKRDGREIKGHP